MHVDKKLDSNEVLMPWQGDGRTTIDRFDVRSLLEYISPSDMGSDCDLDFESETPQLALTAERSIDEIVDDVDINMLNFERYRDLMYLTMDNADEEDVIESIDEDWNDMILKNKQQAPFKKQGYEIIIC